MFQSFMIAFNAVFPFIFYMALGVLIVKVRLTDTDFLNRLNNLVFKLFLPVLLFKNIYYTEAKMEFKGAFIFYAVGSILALVGLLMLFVPRFVKENPRRAVIIQGIFRSNVALFAVPLAQYIYGEECGMLAAIMAAVTVMTFNIMAVIVLEYYRGGAASPIALIKKIATNPLILGIVTGFLFYGLSIPIPVQLETPVKTIASVATPLALMALGGTLKLSEFVDNARPLTAVCLLKLVCIPFVSYLITMMLSFTNMERFMLLIIFVTPTAVSSYTMAQNMGGDGPLAGQIVVMTTLVSMLTIFCFIFCLNMLGLLY